MARNHSKHESKTGPVAKQMATLLWAQQTQEPDIGIAYDICTAMRVNLVMGIRLNQLRDLHTEEKREGSVMVLFCVSRTGSRCLPPFTWPLNDLLPQARIHSGNYLQVLRDGEEVE